MMEVMYRNIKIIIKFLISNTPVQIFSVFLFFFSFFSFYFFLYTFTSTDDQFFNIRLAQKISQEGFSTLQNFNEFSEVPARPWIFNILFYYLLIPFTWFNPLELGIKVFAVTSLSFTFTVLFFFLKKNDIKKPFLWVLFMIGFFFVPPDLWHFLMARAFVLIPALLILLLYCLQKERYVALFFLSFISFFLHTATFFLPIVVGVIFSAFSWQANRRPVRLSLLSIFGGTLMALIVGVLFIPGFLSIVWNFWASLYTILASFHIQNLIKIDEGGESYPTTLFDIFSYHALLVAFITVFITRGVFQMLQAYKRKEVIGNPTYFTLLVLTTLFLLGTFITKRNTDFFFIFSSLFIVFSISEFLKKVEVKDKKVYFFGIIIAIVIALMSQVLAIMDMIATSSDHALIKGAAQWAREHTEKDSIVFNPTMNFFPTFYFYNEGHNKMIVGIEPRDFYNADQRKYWLWYNLSAFGIICEEQSCQEEIALRDAVPQSQKDIWYKENGEKIKEVFLKEFSTNLILVRTDFTTLQSLLQNSPAFEEVYATPITRTYTLYRTKEINK